MCGIVGVLGRHEAAPILVEALKRLEYRGYDSAGIATVNDGRLDRRRAVGKLVNLQDLLVHDPLAGKAGIGHTRWATHGAPSVGNAHPHRAGPVAVVHNGIIENYAELRTELVEQGYACETETDTETVVMLARSYIDRQMSPREAAMRTLDRLRGAAGGGADQAALQRDVGAIITRAPSCSTTSSWGSTSATYSIVYSMPAQPPFLTPMRSPSDPSRVISLEICFAAAGVIETACLPGMPNMSGTPLPWFPI